MTTPQELTWTFPNRYFYLASPYTKWSEGLDDAAHVVSEIAGRLMQHGLPIFCPIAHSHAICGAARMDFLAYDIWYAANQPLMDAAAGILVADLDGWQASDGVMREIKAFREADKPCWLLDPVSLEAAELPVIFGA